MFAQPLHLAARRVGLALMLCATLGAASCASFEPTRIPAEDPSTNPRSNTEHMFVWTATTRSDPVWQERHLGWDLTSCDIVPVVLNLKNRNAANNVFFDVNVATASFSTEDGTEFVRMTPDEVVGRIGYSHWRALPWWFFALFPGLAVNLSVASANQAIHDYYHDIALGEARFMDANIVTKVVFFRPKSGTLGRFADSTFTIEVTRRGGAGNGGSSQDPRSVQAGPGGRR